MTSAEKSATRNIYDPSALPDYDTQFIKPDELHQFEKALNAPAAAPLVAINDWRPINQRVRKNRRTKPRRSKDETREGVLYTVLKWPFLFIVFAWITVLGIAYALTRLYIFLYEQCVTWRGKRERLRRELSVQTNYRDWLTAAQALDTHLGNQKWKETDEYAYYDHLTINKVVAQLKQARKAAESEVHNGRSGVSDLPAVEDLCALLEACVKNNFAGVENPRLYSESYSGTKDLVQEYIDEVQACMQLILDSKQIPAEEKYQHFKHLDTNFGRTALCLSGGATFAYYHFGVIRALLDNDVLPEIITGTSGGALVAALVATRTDEELKQLLVPALAYRIRACHEGFTTWVWRWWRTGARFDTVDWARQCSWFCRGSTTFREAYERTGRILNVSCVPSDPHSPTILANYLTSPDCVIWSAVLASAAVPGILNPVVLMTKKRDGTLAPYSFGHKWKDGSLRTDIPIKALNLHFNVNFTIVSQVNPHINLFFFSSRGTVGRPVTHRKGRGWRGGFLGSAIEQYIKLDMNKWLRVLRHLELLPRPLGQDWSEIWLQKFSGTITIWPKSIPSDFYHILSDPSPERLARMLHVGKQSAFPKIQFIKNRLKIENTIMQGLQQSSPGGDRVLLPILSRRLQNRAQEHADAMVERLDHSFPERHSDYKDESHYTEVSDSLSTNSSRPHTPDARRGSIFEEMRRQSAVFFDDPDMYGDEDAIAT
ncbi:patatin-like phospholipase domain-containing protein [Aspergillus clavatus NRRL 1]|uniref:Patatin-like phospholipase domain-containing protein ACLA_029670 n=1 Tax=Aspergillus clavatus (strain ATCC 1007 / CBS 513.65 / DSM 816 / NCTC 3887 / NRRL 1 / QM 1276 / 107) TaxID=344612 RepID=PLPL_ASPCL|nr:Patatin-like serine hydrolase, putative [Aspergillus clavatus NRRL 1]A1CRG6.1 RecName: Full=Patatin-like phospholipase domain-containing protein ACLA_029670 [Aspergillus clavatus NRRL 1]EAW08237.1 Patatin-like serine hydrolase, putative [Aspergillus clavatus NRRL 1]